MRKKVEVDILVVLYAIRYGMGRMTYANNDASSLARQYWDDLNPSWQRQIKDDAMRLADTERLPWHWLEELDLP